MNIMHHTRYWKLVVAVKIIAIAAMSIFAIPYSFGFAAVFFNSIMAGYITGGLIACVGLWGIIVVLVKGIRGNRNCPEIHQ